jgi:hypothetical protein
MPFVDIGKLEVFEKGVGHRRGGPDRGIPCVLEAKTRQYQVHLEEDP